jgi:hypothetical protein
MANLDALPERVEQIEQKLDALSVSVDVRFEQVTRRFDEVDRRFDEVAQQFVEQREYAEFLYARLEQRMGERFDRLERMRATDSARLERVERKLDRFIDGLSRRALPRPRRPKKP